MVTTTANSHGPRPAVRHIYSYIAQPQLYSDHYPEHQNKPEGIISIAFSRSTIRSIHTNNDPIRGVVHVKSNIKVKSVSIQFIGRSTCRTFEGASQHVCSTELFRHEMALQRISMPSENCPPHRVEYPFEFRFPEAVQLPPSTPCPPDPKFETNPGHALPPSLWWDENTIRNEYVLEAQFVSEERHFTMNPKVIHQLRFSPSVPEVGLPREPPLRPAPPIRLEHTSRLDQAGRGRGRGALRRLSRRFSSTTEAESASASASASSPSPSPSPSPSHLLILSVPSHYRANAPSTLKLTLQSPSHGPHPAIFLRGIRAQAHAHIHYRIPVPSHPSLAYNILRSGDAKFDLFNRRYAIPGLPLAAHAPTCIEAFAINKLVPPSFASYHVALRYDVKYDVLLLCGGRESEHEVLVQDVGIEAMTRPGGWLGPPDEEGAGGEDNGEGDRRVELVGGTGGVEPPAYEP
ncbi:hypothetical protein SVAN01_01549 [Stagonosporopsis vannaccii]|nr:hypothetical protein SVAN01_01549 [Stagonosporopsis vannaccii]